MSDGERPDLHLVPEGGRPQDQGRKHRRAGRPSPETASLLADYQSTMRDELRATLTDIRGSVPDSGLGLSGPEPKRPALGERMKLWDLAIKLGRELGTEVDPAGGVGGDAAPAAPSGRRRRRRVDFGPDR